VSRIHAFIHVVIIACLLLAVVSGPMAFAQQPPNDSCAGAQPITGDVNEFFLTFGATTDSSLFDAGVCGFDRIFNDVWYCYTATATGTCVVSTCQNAFFDTRIAVFNGCSCPADPSNVVSCNDDCPADTVNGTSTATFDATAGSQYLICIGSASPAQFGEGVFTVSCGTACDPLVAGFTANPPSGAPPLTVNFTNTSTGTGPFIYEWDFGDGSAASAEESPVHIYANPGTYNVFMGLEDACSNIEGTEQTISVECDPLVAVFTVEPFSGTAPLTVEFFNDTTGTGPFQFTWNFGDGSAASTVEAPIHVYANPGDYLAVLSVTDACGNTDVFDQEIEVIACDPLVAVFTVEPFSGTAPLTVEFFNDTTGTGPFLYEWNFGDGSAASTVEAPIHVYANPGNYLAVLTAEDACGNTDTYNQEIEVVACDPALAIFTVDPTSGPAPLFVQFFNDSTGTGPLQYTWNFGDGGFLSEESSPPVVYYDYQTPGTYVASLTVENGCGPPSQFFSPIITVTASEDNFLRGDPNGDLQIDISDPIKILGYLFSNVPLSCEDAADVNDDGGVDIADAINSLFWLFDGTGACIQFPPSDGCGPDPTDDDLGCEVFNSCP